MGTDIAETGFTPQMERAFALRLQENLTALRQVLAWPHFGRGEGSLGAELEMYLVDAHGRPRCVNKEVQGAAGDPQLTLELNRYNLEYNLSPHRLSARPFEATEREMLARLAWLRDKAAAFGARILTIGILPTLTPDDFGPATMTDRSRYHVLVEGLKRSRGGRFEVHIDGRHPLDLLMDDVTLEGANTSFQIHYRVAPDAYADTFNAVQLVTPLAVAIAGNSPGLFGHDLWCETRIPLFKQSIDTRIKDRYHWHQSPRVGFGSGWVRQGAHELFAESVLLYPPFFPICGEEHPLVAVARGLVPKLEELRLHQGTVWLWNRPVYDDAEGGHLRIELRALPAGPTPVDMVANAALYIGLAEGLRPQINRLLPALPFSLAEYNFYRAAQDGLDARLVWPAPDQNSCHEYPVTDLLATLLPVAHDGLRAIGIAGDEAERYLAVIEQRLSSGQTGAAWQRRVLAECAENGDPASAAQAMLARYDTASLSNTPVGEWD
ncbi:glutamate--cysteine ligase [Nitrogeniibacter mangrovi]|uniref:Glutamate--cysteine ligase n=1 Tax=Nitrogeniibacter mangrovi TaxID=2016596 RepID=A0A6C1AZ41_9RHOO|nr:glutamate--cysteine ligase [Nitrogeniibacter mangrovi]QID16622.1 glutamate--cysteine ligase [Nitrogeniibacter mangrovi]